MLVFQLIGHIKNVCVYNETGAAFPPQYNHQNNDCLVPCSSSLTEIPDIVTCAAQQAEIVGWCRDIKESRFLSLQ